MVLASRPVASPMRLAARPVGAHRAYSVPISSKRVITKRKMVVLPVPGPPVITNAPAFNANSTAWRWAGARVISSCCSNRAIWAFGRKKGLSKALWPWSRNSRRAQSCSVRNMPGKNIPSSPGSCSWISWPSSSSSVRVRSTGAISA